MCKSMTFEEKYIPHLREKKAMSLYYGVEFTDIFYKILQ